MNIGELVQLRSIALRAEGRSPKTIEQLEWTRKRFMRYLESQGAIPEVSQVSATHLRGFILHLNADGLTPETQSFYIRCLRALFRWAQREELIESDPGSRVKPPKVPRKVVPAPTDETLLALIEAAKGARFALRNRAILLVLFDTGLRASEMLGLEIEDVNWESQQVRVLGKGAKERTVPVGFQAMRALTRYVHREREAPKAVRAVFVALERTPLTYNGLNLVLRRLAVRAGVAHVSAHKLRHGFARAYLRNGGDVFTLQKILGHSTLEMTRRYAELSLEDVTRAHQRSSPMDRLKARRK